MKQNLVGISVHVDPDLLRSINEKINEKDQSKRIRKCLRAGYQFLTEGESQNARKT